MLRLRWQRLRRADDLEVHHYIHARLRALGQNEDDWDQGGGWLPRRGVDRHHGLLGVPRRSHILVHAQAHLARVWDLEGKLLLLLWRRRRRPIRGREREQVLVGHFAPHVTEGVLRPRGAGRAASQQQAAGSSSSRQQQHCAGSQEPNATRSSSYRSLPLLKCMARCMVEHPAAVTPSLYVTDTACVGHMYHIVALP
jgi:hypothetical protein|eukprot:COSAG01_NODE_1856_length_9043_cov_87.168679_4_plen_197_part_00